MKNALYLDTTPPRFWSTLVQTDRKLHRAASGRMSPALATTTNRLMWGYAETTFDGTEGWYRNTTWYGRKWLGPLSTQGRLRIEHTSPEAIPSLPPDDPDTDHPLPWLAPLIAEIDRTTAEEHAAAHAPQSADEVYAGYNFSPVHNDYTLFVRHRTHTSIYTLPHKLLEHQRAAIYVGTYRSEPNPTPDDCQMILDEMRIGAGEMYGYPPLEQ